MTSKRKNNVRESDKKNEYRIKKINKSKNRSEKRNDALIYPEEDFNFNELPSGAFDKIYLNSSNKEMIMEEDDNETNKMDQEQLNTKEDEDNDKIKKMLLEDEDEQEEVFDESYFIQVPYVKK
jgi:hypothetical protein